MKTNKPGELVYAEMILDICARFGVLPSQVEAEDASLLRMLYLIDADCGKAD